PSESHTLSLHDALPIWFWANVSDVSFEREANPIKPALPVSMKRRRVSFFRFIKIPSFSDQFRSSILQCLYNRRDPYPNLRPTDPRDSDRNVAPIYRACRHYRCPLAVSLSSIPAIRQPAVVNL